MIRPTELPDIATPEPSDPEVVPTASTLLPRTIKVCLVLAVVGFGATQYLSHAVDGVRGAIYRQEARLGRPGADPETTGSIGGQARTITLDPCTATPASRIR